MMCGISTRFPWLIERLEEHVIFRDIMGNFYNRVEERVRSSGPGHIERERFIMTMLFVIIKILTKTGVFMPSPSH